MQTTARLALSVIAAASLAGCDGNAIPPPATNSVSTSAPTLTTVTDERFAIESVYREFWDRLHQVTALEEAALRANLSEVMAEPQLSTTLGAIAGQRQAGITIYGNEVAHIASIEIAGDSATVKDCQDASQSGQAEVTTGKRNTVGVSKNPITATVVRRDGRWKISQIAYPGGTC